MPSSYNLQIPPPSNWQDFESLCCDLWREIWKDPDTQKNGKRGQAQKGVDISGTPDKGKSWCGVQCKCKENDLNKKLTEREVYTEINKAKSFRPELSELVIATTGPKDAKIEELARKITTEHKDKGLFSVSIWSWDDIKNNLSKELLKDYYPDFGVNLVQQEHISELISVIENSKVLFIGDELSKKSDVKSFRIFIIEVIQSITNHKFDRTEYDELSEKLPSESAFKILHDELGDNVLVYFEDFILHEPNPIHYYVANQIKNGKWVFTTNRDNLIERACKNEKILLEHDIICDDFDFTEFNDKIEDSHDSLTGCLFKLNGSIEEGEEEEIEIRYKSILANLNRIRKILEEKKVDEKKELLEYFLKKYDFCFLGFDCLDNFSFFPILKNTNTDKSMFCLNYIDKSDKENIEIIRKKEDLEYEVEKEISNRLIDRPRDVKKLYINNILLKRKNFLKITGNWIEIIQNELCSSFNMNYYTDLEPIKSIDYSNEKAELSNKIDEYEINIIFGLLWEDCLSKVKAIEFFNKAIFFSEKINKAQAIRSVNKARAIQSLARVYDTQFGESEKDTVFDQYQNCFEIYNNVGIKYKDIQYKYKAIQCKLGLANYKRRALKRFKDALIDCEDIKKMLEEIDKDERKTSGSQIKDKEYNLIYAQYHSCVGLIYSTYKEIKYINESIRLLNCSLDYRKEAGDIKGIADSENSIGLIKGTNYNENIGELNDAISHLSTSLNINESIGNFIGAARNYRNLGLCYKDSIRLNEDEVTKEKNFHQAKDSYKNSLNYWYMITGEPPIEEVLECRFRLGELEIKYGNVDEGIKLLQKVDSDFKKRGKWHNRIRTLNLLSEAYVQKRSRFTKSEAKLTIDKIISIYDSVLNDQVKLKEQMKNNKKIFENAVEIINNAKNIIKYYEDKSKSFGEFQKRRTSLDEILGKLKDIENENCL